LRIRLTGGRAFQASDREGTPLVAIVSEALARRFWPGREALGQQLRLEAGLATVVGVAQDSRYNSVAEAAPALLYLPFRQAYVPGQRVLVRTQAGPAATAALVEREVAALDKDLPIVSSMPLQDWIDVARLPQRMAGQITGSLGALGVLLAGIGIYGIIAYSVNQRTREIGLRAALGANRRSLLGLVLGEGARLALGGIVLGGLAAMAVGRAVAGFVPGVPASDPLALLMASVMILTTALIASFVPARRAARLDPIAALREK